MKYIFKRIGQAIITLFVVSVIVFAMFQIIPGDVVTTKLGTNASPERIEELREYYGLDNPAYIQYKNWIDDIFWGELGISYSKDLPVAYMINPNVKVTLCLASLSLLIIVVFAVPIGLGMGYIASKKKRKDVLISNGFDIINQTFMAIPSFFIGIIISIVFGLILKWFTPGQYVAIEKNAVDFFLYLIPAAVSVAIPKIAMLVRFIKSSVEEEIAKDYVRTARSKSASNIRILFCHVLKNSMITSITALSVIMAEIFAGSVVVEQVFNLPGIGKALIGGIGERDYPVVMAIVMYISAMIIIVNLLADVIYSLVDPRAGGNHEKN